MITDSTIASAKAFAQSVFATDASGHDYAHTLRVYRLARRIAAQEGADEGIVSLAALLHDVDDHKLSPATSESLGRARAFMAEQGVAGAEAEAVLTAIREVSFSRNRDAAPSSLEAACVRDADRLDAIGAIGIARAFAFGGSHGRPLHADAECAPEADANAGTTIGHFYDKLLLLAGMMCTAEGQRVAAQRHAYLQNFLAEFLAEWAGDR